MIVTSFDKVELAPPCARDRTAWDWSRDYERGNERLGSDTPPRFNSNDKHAMNINIQEQNLSERSKVMKLTFFKRKIPTRVAFF